MLHKDSDLSVAAQQPLFQEVLIQGRSWDVVQWSVVSLDLMIGIVGGFVGLMYLAATSVMGGY